MPTDIGSVTPQHLAKLLQMVPADLTPSNLHAMFASGTLSDLLRTEAPALKKFQDSSLWRDTFCELIGLPPVSLRFNFTVAKSTLRDFVRSLEVNRMEPGTIRDRLEQAKMVLASQTSVSFYRARRAVTCVSFAAGYGVREAIKLAEFFGYHPADSLQYLRFLAYLKKTSTDRLPRELLDTRIIGCFSEEDNPFSSTECRELAHPFLCAYRSGLPKAPHRQWGQVRPELIQLMPSRTWLVLTKQRQHGAQAGSLYSGDDGLYDARFDD